MHYRATLGLTLAGLLFGAGGVGHAWAEGLKIKDGLWRTTVNNPMTGERTSEECLKDAVLDPSTMVEGQNECRMTEQKLEGNTLTFAMTCAGGSGSAQGHMFVDGDKGGGELTMKFDMGGRPIDMTMTWDAVRVGDC